MTIPVLSALQNLEISNDENNNTLCFSDHVRHSLSSYLKHLDGDTPNNLYDVALAELEVPLLRAVMGYTFGNQSRAARVLGLSRGTLRKKLAVYGID